MCRMWSLCCRIITLNAVEGFFGRMELLQSVDPLSCGPFLPGVGASLYLLQNVPKFCFRVVKGFQSFRIDSLSTFDITTPARDKCCQRITPFIPFPVSASGPFRMVIINAPKVFSIAWTFVKPQLDEKTVAKISIFGSDQREALHGRKDDKSRSARKKSRAKMSKD